MKKFIKSVFRTAVIASLLSLPVFAQVVKRTPFDVTNYVMDVSLSPAEHKINATVDVSFTPLEDTRSISFELNGSLKIDTITRLDRSAPAAQPASTTPVKGVLPKVTPSAPSAVTFVQDQTGVGDLGPSVRIDMGDSVSKGTPVVLRFKYSGVLDTASGGPLLSKRLAYIGENQGYLMYAAR